MDKEKTLSNNIFSEHFINNRIAELKEKKLLEISPQILIKPASFSLILLAGSFLIDLSSVPLLGNISISIASALFPGWEYTANNIVPLPFWWLPVLSYIFFVSIAAKEYKGLFSHVRNTTPRENIDRIISSSISLIDGYSTALPLIGAAFLLVSIKLGPEIFLGLAVPFEIKALVVLAIAKLFEPVLDYIGVKFQKVINAASDYEEQYYRKIQLEQTDKLINLIAQNKSEDNTIPDVRIASMQSFKEEMESIKKVSFETYQNFSAINKLTLQIKNNLGSNEEQLKTLDNLSKDIDSMAANLNNEAVSRSLLSLENIVTKR